MRFLWNYQEDKPMTIARRELMYIGAAATATVGLRGAKAQAPAGFAESQDGGYFSNFGNAGFIWSHGCASDVHTSTCGLNQLGSSKLAVLIATNWGTESGLTTIGEPQSGQKPRRVLPPISLGEAWKRSEPCKSLKASVGTMTKDENGPPLDCWQSRQ